MKSLLRISMLIAVLLAVTFLSAGCGEKRTKTVIIEKDITVPVTEPQEVIVPDPPVQPAPPPPPPAGGGGTEVLVAAARPGWARSQGRAQPKAHA